MTETASALWINSTFAGFDAAITTAIHHLYEIGGGFFTPFFEFISLLGKGGAFLILLSLLLTFYRPTRRFGTAMCLGLALGALVTNCCLKVLIARARPYADESSIYYQFWQLVGMHTESDKSFPSGRTHDRRFRRLCSCLSDREKANQLDGPAVRACHGGGEDLSLRSFSL